MFAKHSYRDVKRRKLHFFLAFCSVFVAVLSTLVVNTLISQGPVVFLKLAEATVGEYDALMTPVPYSAKSFSDYYGPYG